MTFSPHAFASCEITPPVWRRVTFSETIRSAWDQSDAELLTCDPDSRLAALGGSQVAPGDAQAPVVLGAVEVLHLLTRDVDHHLADLQPCGRDGWSLGLAFNYIDQRDGDRGEENLNLIRLSAVKRSAIHREQTEDRMLVDSNAFQGFCLYQGSKLYKVIKLDTLLQVLLSMPLLVVWQSLVKTSVSANRWAVM